MTRNRLALANKETLCAAILVGVALTLAACGSSSSSGTGGSGAGGTTATGGKGGSGIGGHGVGGLTGTGGVGTGGSQACNAAPYNHVTTFGAISDNWVVAGNSTPPTLAPPAPGVDAGGVPYTKFEIDTADGFPVANGSAKLTIPFDTPNEVLLFAQNMNINSGANMMGATISAYVKLDSGLNTTPTDVGIAYMVLKTTASYNYVAGPVISLDRSAGWVPISISADAPQAAPPPGYDPCDVREIDVVIATGGTGAYTTAVVHIDTITISRPGTDAGMDDGGAVDAPATTDAGDAAAATDTAVDTGTSG